LRILPAFLASKLAQTSRVSDRLQNAASSEVIPWLF
jgi:hypothetical protein